MLNGSNPGKCSCFQMEFGLDSATYLAQFSSNIFFIYIKVLGKDNTNEIFTWDAVC